MCAAGWMSLVRLDRRLSTRPRSSRIAASKKRRATPGLESLELISLLSAGRSPIGAAALRLHMAQGHRSVTPVASKPAAVDDGMPVNTTLHTLPAQTVSLPATLTNFANEPLSPALNLFDPSLGTLASVTVIQSATLQSNITSQNLSTTSGTVITAGFSGSYQINGLKQPIVQPTESITSAPMPAGVFGSGSDTVTFPPVQLNRSSTTVFSDPASLAFFTASSGRTTVTPTMTATASRSASAPNGNLFTVARSTASATVSVVYTYVPSAGGGTNPAPISSTGTVPGTGGGGGGDAPPPPSFTGETRIVVRVGKRHKKLTEYQLGFSGALDAAEVANTGLYAVAQLKGHSKRAWPVRVAVTSAAYNSATHGVTLTLGPSARNKPLMLTATGLAGAKGATVATFSTDLRATLFRDFSPDTTGLGVRRGRSGP
jgi:hypothetical protein